MLGELLEITSLDGIQSLNVACDTECPAGAALSLILDLGDGVLLPPVKVLGQLTRISGHRSWRTARRLILAALPETRSLCILCAGHVGKFSDAILGTAHFIGIQLLDGAQILTEDAQTHLMLETVGIATLVLDLELVEQMIDLVERMMSVFLVCLLLGPLHGARVTRMHHRLIAALERDFVSLL